MSWAIRGDILMKRDVLMGKEIEEATRGPSPALIYNSHHLVPVNEVLGIAETQNYVHTLVVRIEQVVFQAVIEPTYHARLEMDASC
jgi:hypothetical protein